MGHPWVNPLRAAVTWVLAGALGAPACADDSTSSSEALNAASFCAVYGAALRECGLLSEGEFAWCVEEGDAAEQCEISCVREASCDALNLYACLTSGSLLPCFDACIGLEPYVCSDGSEIDPTFRCDGEPDCCGDDPECAVPDDEQGCENYVLPYKCRNVDETVPDALVCDGQPDCSDGSDEPAVCDATFACADGATIPRELTCDGERHCQDGSDESQDCAVEQFLCARE